MSGYRTDLAMEAQGLSDAEGVKQERLSEDGVKVTRISVTNEKTAQALGKPIGTYVTLESDELCARDPAVCKAITRLIAQELQRLLPPLNKGDAVLVVGLGNWNMTADALGPKAARRALVSRHILEAFPDTVDDRMRPVCALSPGVLGLTGVKTYEVVAGVTEHVKPACVVCVDALAAASLSRILSTVQLCDTGVQPGSGIGGKTKALSKETLGVPVLAIGVPMVVYASTIMREAVRGMMDVLKEASGQGGSVYAMLDTFGEEGMEALIEQGVGGMERMVVTPKQIDEAVDACAELVAMGINKALFPELDDEEIMTLTAR